MAETKDLSGVQAKGLYTSWTKKIEDSLEREKSYRSKAQKVVDLYEAKQPDDVPFAIVYSNTETLVPAVYNARPIPIVTRRYKDADPLGKVTSEVGTRMLKYLVDIDSQDYDCYDEIIQAAVLDGLVTNRGLSRFKFVPDSGLPECVYGETVRWDKFFHGYARTWKKVPWIGFEWDMTEDEIRKNFQDVKVVVSKANLDEDFNEVGRTESRQELTGVSLFKVFEIWDKRTRKVYFFSAVYPDGPLKVVEDPLGLSSFFPVPKPMNFMRKITTLIPTPLYEHYRSQAQELNTITKRLKAIIAAIRYRGAFNSAVEGIDRMLSAEDNELVPVENVASMPDGTGMDKLLWIVPVQELAQTAQALFQQREQIKQVIYEITGISDILRGASVASETATAQNIKNQWGTLRLKKMQKEVQRYCRDSLAIIFEIAANKFEPSTIQQMTGLPYMTEGQKAQIQQQMVMQQQQAAMQAQMTGQQPQPPQIPPELENILQQPTWEEITQLLRNQVLLHYKTDIETNSTIDAEAAQDKQDISELLNALSQFLNGLAPLVEKGMMPFAIAKEMLLVISRRYNFGSQLEDQLQAMQEPPPPQAQVDPNEELKAKAEEAKVQADMKKMEMEGQLAQQEFENKKQLMLLEAQIAQQELRIKQQELLLQEKALGLKMQVQSAQHAQKMQMLASKAEEAKETAHAAV